MHGVGAQAKATRTMNWREHDRWARIAIPPGPISPPAARARARALADRYLLLQFGMQPAGHARARAGDPPPDALMTATYGEPAQHAAAAPPYPRRLALSLGQTLPFCSVLAGHTGWKNVNIPQARATTYDSNTHTNNWQGRALRHTYVELGRQGCSMIERTRARDRETERAPRERERARARAPRADAASGSIGAGLEAYVRVVANIWPRSDGSVLSSLRQPAIFFPTPSRDRNDRSRARHLGACGPVDRASGVRFWSGVCV